VAPARVLDRDRAEPPRILSVEDDLSQEAFLPAVEQTGNSEVVAIVSGSLDKAKQLADFYGIEGVYPYEQFDALAGSGIYVGLVAAVVLVCFGLTIVVKRVAQPYVVADPDDDV